MTRKKRLLSFFKYIFYRNRFFTYDKLNIYAKKKFHDICS